ncbi:hypothetical protein ACIHFE_01280 [Streptomyces sp. NPDC052396]|uniref:hypothetical protein n=1 Tax=Streptomyces sp. NPDC052396 TaxID=3365689 RepID=UPI0037D1ADC6
MISPTGSSGRRAGVLIAAVALTGALTSGCGSAKDDSRPHAAGGATLTIPDRLLDGRFRNNHFVRGTADMSQDRQAKELGLDETTEVGGTFVDDHKQKLAVMGMYGRIAQPRKTLDALAETRQKDDRKDGVSRTPWTEFHPAGLGDAVLKCSTAKSRFTMGSTTVFSDTGDCVWADAHTAAVVHLAVEKEVPQDADSATGDPMSARQLATATGKIRQETRHSSDK